MLVRIMGCKERERNINKMLEELPEHTEVIWDQNKDVIDTLCRALDTDEDLIVMEDDLELCDGFFDKVQEEIKKHPDCFIQFYSAGPDETRKIEDENFTSPRVWTQAYYIPGGRGIARGMADMVKHDTGFSPLGRYSLPMMRYLKKNGVKIHLVRPSLCQHLWWGRSLLPGHQYCYHHSKTYKKNLEENNNGGEIY